MIDALIAADAAMQNDLVRMQALSQNLANTSTVGYKKEIPVTRPVFDDLFSRSLTTTHRTTAPIPAPTIFTDRKQGVLTLTQNPLDLALEGDGLFTLQGESGYVYTRQGSFHLDAGGRLVTSLGYPVLGTAGEITLTIPNPVIDRQGRVWEGDKQVAQLSITTFANPDQLNRLGAGLYSASSEDGTLVSTTSVKLRQGYVEVANVIAAEEMVRMIETVRHFESSQRVIQGVDSMLDRAINVLAEF